MIDRYTSVTKEIARGRVIRYSIFDNNQPLSYAEVLDLWESNESFRSFFSQVLAGSPFAAFRWETPMLSASTVSRDFEFVLVNEPSFIKRKSDRNTYKEKFASKDQGIVSFSNLSGDATLIVPSPKSASDDYGHLAAFIRNATEEQRDAIWRVVAACVKERLSEVPIWVSTAGGGVAWLHIRLDCRPKYYGYEPYRVVN